MKIKLDPGAYMPERAHILDAGLDMRTPHDITIPAGGSVIVDTGVHMAIPMGYVGFLKSKSGLNIKSGITSEGVIDAGYTGSIVAKLYNNGDQDKEIKAGSKVTQLVIIPIVTPELEIVSFLPDTERGDSGFGSTGT